MDLQEPGMGDAGLVRASMVPPEMIEFLWSDIAPRLQMAEDLLGDKDRQDVNTFLPHFLSGEWRVVMSMQGNKCVTAAIMRIIEKPGGKVMRLDGTGSAGSSARFSEWAPAVMTLVKSVAKQMGCYKVVTDVSRRGWFKMAKEFDFKETKITFECDLGD